MDLEEKGKRIQEIEREIQSLDEQIDYVSKQLEEGRFLFIDDMATVEFLGELYIKKEVLLEELRNLKGDE